METFHLLCYIVAAISFILGVYAWPYRINLISLGLFFWVLVPLVDTIRAY